MRCGILDAAARAARGGISMGVYIFDMAMPTSCDACPLRASCVHRIYLERRADYCPLVYVPPHGRLIDADALIKSDSVVGKLMMFGGEYIYTQSEIDRAPTIIPVDLEKEE